MLCAERRSGADVDGTGRRIERSRLVVQEVDDVQADRGARVGDEQRAGRPAAVGLEARVRKRRDGAHAQRYRGGRFGWRRFGASFVDLMLLTKSISQSILL